MLQKVLKSGNAKASNPTTMIPKNIDTNFLSLKKGCIGLTSDFFVTVRTDFLRGAFLVFTIYALYIIFSQCKYFFSFYMLSVGETPVMLGLWVGIGVGISVIVGVGTLFIGGS